MKSSATSASSATSSASATPGESISVHPPRPPCPPRAQAPLGHASREAPLRAEGPTMDAPTTGSRASRRAFPSRAWERGDLGARRKVTSSLLVLLVLLV